MTREPKGTSDHDRRTTRTESNRVRVGRRPVLAALGAVAVGSGFAGVADAGRYGDVVNLVEDHGADPTGVESVTPVLYECRSEYGDDTLLKFPPGEYHMDAQFRFTGFSNFGLAGSGATIVPADYDNFDGPQFRLFRLGTEDDPGRDLQFKGFSIDQTDDGTGIRVIDAVVRDGLDVADVTITGAHDSGTWGPAHFCIIDRDGWGSVRRFAAPDGGIVSSNAPGGLERGPTGILLGTDHVGTIEFRDCVLGGFPDNGLYAVTYGTVRVIGGHYRNSDTASIRLGGYDCVVRDATVTVDANPQGFANQRGIRLDAGTGFLLEDVTIDLSRPNGHAITVKDHVGTTRIENVDVTVGDRVNHGIVIRQGANETDVVDSNVVLDGGGNAIRIEGNGAGRVVVERTNVWGQASGATFRHAIRCERDGCELRRVKIWQPGPHKRRAAVLEGDDCLVYDCTFVSRHHPILVNGDGAWIEANSLESYDDHAAIRLDDGSASATIKDNTLDNGILDEGSAGLRMYGNETA